MKQTVALLTTIRAGKHVLENMLKLIWRDLSYPCLLLLVSMELTHSHPVKPVLVFGWIF